MTTSPSEDHAARESAPNGLHRLLMDKSHPGESHFGSATYNDVSAEDCDAIEAAIRRNERQRIAKELQKDMDEVEAVRKKGNMYKLGWVVGIEHALRIIERGGAAKGGERGGNKDI